MKTTTSSLPALSIGLLLAATGALSAQSWSWPLNPRQTYLHTNSDSPLAPLVLDLASLGIAPGDWLRIGTTGGFRYINGGADDFQSLVGVFSSTSTLLASSVQHRVPGAIAAGPHFVSGNTYYGAQPIDIVEDFFCSRNAYEDHIQVRVPAGAAFLFLGVHDSLYNDNVDPNGDYAVVVDRLPPPLLPGTGEHLTLRSAVNGTPAETPGLHLAAAGAAMNVELRYPVGFLDGAIYLLLGDAAPVGQIPQLLPNVYVQNLIVLRAGVLVATPGWSDAWSLSAPAGLAGLALIVQGAALSSVTRNGFYETTDAHAFVLQ